MFNVRERGIGAREELASLLRGMRLIVASGPVHSVATAVLAPVSALTAPVVTVQLGAIVSMLPAVIEGSPDTRLPGALTILVAAFLAGRVLGPVIQLVAFAHGERWQRTLTDQLIAAATSLPGLSHFEDPAFRDRLHVAEWAVHWPQSILLSLTGAIGSVVGVAGYAFVASTYRPWIPALMLVACLPGAVAGSRGVAGSGWARRGDSQEARKAMYFRSLTTDLAAAKEARVFGMSEFVRERQRMHWHQAMARYWRVKTRTSAITAALGAVAVAGAGLVYALLLRDLISGSIDPGMFVATSVAVYALAAGLPGLLDSVAFVRRDAFYLPDAFRIIDAPRLDPRMSLTVSPRSPSVSEGIRLEGVTFRYPRTTREVLHGLDLEITRGQSVALVGENGAGKTTILKLLCRLYDPDEGRIMLDGVDLRDYDLHDVRRRMAMLFQDFGRYALSARDNIGFGAPERIDDTDLLRTAAERSGAVDTLDALADGWETVLSRAFGGTDLSGGEWQRVGLARTIAAQLCGADVLVLDEPTASLDVRQEHELYNRFLEIRGDCTTILVSHRFSTVRMAERIVYLSDGCVTEDGSHASLVSKGGSYAQLYELQARHYRDNGAVR